MATTPQKSTASAPDMDALVTAAVEKSRAADKKAAHLEKVRQHGGLCEEPKLVRWLGTIAVPLRSMLAKAKTALSLEPKPEASPTDVLKPGAVLALGVGDLDLVQNDATKWQLLTEDEAAAVIPVQVAVAFRQAERPLVSAKQIVQMAEQDIARRQAAVAQANKDLANAQGVLEVANRAEETEAQRFAAFVSGTGHDEAVLREAVESLRPDPVEESEPRVVLPAPPLARATERSVETVERVNVVGV